MNKTEKEKVLGKVNSPEDLKNLTQEELGSIAREIRDLIISVVSKNGGHLSSNLGAVELTLALHYVFDSPKDKIVWDVGHQCYTHKIITGRKDRFSSLRQFEGISGFPSPVESKHDHFVSGHGSTAISVALGFACSRDIAGEKGEVIAIVGDASLVGGMAFEALNYLGHIQKDLLIVLNDNEWAISRTIGALSKHLNRIITDPLYNKVSNEIEKLLLKLPKGDLALRAAKKLEESLKNLLVPGIIFEEMGIKYIGPIDGHDFNELISTFKNIKSFNKPVLVHVLTKKGRGYSYSEKEPELFHSASKFDLPSGDFLKKDKPSYTGILSKALVDMAIVDPKVVAVTAAMPYGTGLSEFKSRFPERFFDVGMAEQNAVTFAAALAKSGFKPFVAIYSTFIQRAYDQIMHDVALQNLPVKFCLDRAGLAGEDGPTHHGVFDIAFMKHLPNMVLMAPKDGWEFTMMLEWMKDLECPSVIRYPKAAVPDLSSLGYRDIQLAKSELLIEGQDIALFGYGSTVATAYNVSKRLQEEGLNPYLVNLRFAKPLDYEMIIDIAKRVDYIFVLEEGSSLGGVAESIAAITTASNIDVIVKSVGIADNFVTYGARDILLNIIGLDEKSILSKIVKLRKNVKDNN
ncbi:MAG: 1-deoxy-D-xylulose-5-phosphate synthase [Candidatus Kaelpia aquatica]|nr:1-deoxy-D-xylulose-5-phosphate synthase [Candidatus Kaelpia aquatica]